MHLLLAPFFPGLVFVEAGEIAVVALVERLILEHGNIFLFHFLEHQIKRTLRAHERRGEGNIEAQPLRLKPAAGGARLADAVLGQIDVAPAGEQIFQIPLALAVAHEHEKPVTHSLFPFCRHYRAKGAQRRLNAK